MHFLAGQRHLRAALPQHRAEPMDITRLARPLLPPHPRLHEVGGSPGDQPEPVGQQPGGTSDRQPQGGGWVTFSPYSLATRLLTGSQLHLIAGTANPARPSGHLPLPGPFTAGSG
ncbi:hypothetical protein [Kitasatospora sp. GP82]|uniref:hypothetical protein n=1 Tax=Kitasatospora sp. GP82 TaxID=3035089 RepID=UPI0024744B26|nr:hypothetical protein [Kitasatospora sp. GP82]MDH6128251.1 hypothetical protein [Kitasatospora sp. GP82]